MEKFKKALIKTLYPHPVILILAAIVSVLGLIYVFTSHSEGSFYAPVIYVISFYALSCIVARIIPATKQIKTVLHSNKHTARYLSEAEYRVRISLYTGTVINIIFSVFKFLAGVYYNSNWFIQVSVYYAVLSIIRYILIHNDRQNKKHKDDNLLHGWKSYRLCGCLLLLLNTTISVMVFRVIWQNKGFSYPGLVIYAMAAYTFYRLIITIIRLVKTQKNNPIFSAAKALDLSISLMSLFSLQTAMFTSFGTDTSEETRFIMNIFTGCAVCLSVVCIAVIMIIKSNKKIKFIS